MSKILAKQVFSYIDKDKNTVISFVCKENYAANLFVREVEKMDLIEVSAKLYKEYSLPSPKIKCYGASLKPSP